MNPKGRAGQLKAQEQHLRRAQIFPAKLGPDHPYVAENLAQWAALPRKTGDDAVAERMEARAKAIRGE